MAIYGAVPPPENLETSAASPAAADPSVPTLAQTPPPAALNPPQTVATPVDIESWSLHALQSLSISPKAVGTGKPYAINIDEHVTTTSVTIAADGHPVQNTPIRRPLSRRDSQKKREALLKGNEGSRQRRRWENGSLSFRPILPAFPDPLPSTGIAVR